MHRGPVYELESDERKIRAKCVVVCNGMGDPKTNAFASDRRSEKIMLGDDFLSQCSAGSPLAKSIGQMNLAVIGAGDTANCVMERILPLVYPSSEYGPSTYVRQCRSPCGLVKQPATFEFFFITNAICSCRRTHRIVLGRSSI